MMQALVARTTKAAASRGSAVSEGWCAAPLLSRTDRPNSPAIRHTCLTSCVPGAAVSLVSIAMSRSPPDSTTRGQSRGAMRRVS
jgi:hypothetical protein